MEVRFNIITNSDFLLNTDIMDEYFLNQFESVLDFDKKDDGYKLILNDVENKRHKQDAFHTILEDRCELNFEFVKSLQLFDAISIHCFEVLDPSLQNIITYLGENLAFFLVGKLYFEKNRLDLDFRACNYEFEMELRESLIKGNLL